MPGLVAIDPSVETFTDPNDQGADQAFVQCASGTALLDQFDSGSAVSVSQVYGRPGGPLGAPQFAIASAVFTDGSSADANTAYQRAASPAFARCWASALDALNAAQGITVPLQPSIVVGASAPTVGDASTAYAIHYVFTVSGAVIRGELGGTVVRSGAYLLIVFTTTTNGQAFPAAVRNTAVTRIAGRIPLPVPVHIDTVVFVHGIRAGCDEPGKTEDPRPSGVSGSYEPLFDAVVGSGMGMYSFCYDHDLAFSRNSWDSSLCFSPTTSHGPDINAQVSFDANTGPLHASQSPTEAKSSGYDDGLGPLAYDATKLDDCLAALVAYDRSQHHSGAIAVIGNSMGGAITRGWLQLAQARQSSSLSEVTTVIMLEAASEGSQIALAGSGASVGILAGNPLTGALIDAGLQALLSTQQLGRVGYVGLPPGITDLTPGSGWYQSVVAAGSPPASLHYFTFSVGVQFSLTFQEVFWSYAGPTGPLLGDGIMQLGDPDPEAQPATGGSEFLPGGEAADRHQYVLLPGPYPLTVNITLGPLSMGASIAGAAAQLVSAITSDPYSHFQFGAHTGSNIVPSCSSGHQNVIISDEIVRLLRDPVAACQ